MPRERVNMSRGTRKWKWSSVQIFVPPYTQVPVLFTATEPHARDRMVHKSNLLSWIIYLPYNHFEYEHRDKEMKVVFSPNLSLSAYPSTSAFYCDRATCTREERVYKMKDRLDRSYTLLISRSECFLLRQGHMHERQKGTSRETRKWKWSSVQIFISPYTQIPVLFTATEPHARDRMVDKSNFISWIIYLPYS